MIQCGSDNTSQSIKNQSFLFVLKYVSAIESLFRRSFNVSPSGYLHFHGQHIFGPAFIISKIYMPKLIVDLPINFKQLGREQ